MTKQDLIDFLEKEQTSRSESYSLNYYQCCSEDKSQWRLHRPAVDWVEDELEILEDGTVKIYQWLSGINVSPTVSIVSYEDFLEPNSKNEKKEQSP